MKKVIGFGGVESVDFSDWRNGAASLFHTASALKGKRNSTHAPANSGVIKAFIAP